MTESCSLLGTREWGARRSTTSTFISNIFLQKAGNLAANEANYFMLCAKGIQSSGPNSYFIVENNTFYGVDGRLCELGAAIIETRNGLRKPTGGQHGPPDHPQQHIFPDGYRA